MRVEFAFLRYINPIYLRETSCIPFNWLVVKASGTKYIHAQVVFEDSEGYYTTYSVEKFIGVRKVRQKTFTREGWDFITMDFTPEEVKSMRSFLEEQVGKPYNKLGSWLTWLWPTSGEGKSWFCSELVAATLQKGGKLMDVFPEATYPGQIKELCLKEPGCRATYNTGKMIEMHKAARSYDN